MAPSSGLWSPIALKMFKHAFKRTSNLIKARIVEASRPLNSKLQPILVRSSPRQPIHRIAQIQQSKGKWYTTHSTVNALVRRSMTTAREHAVKYDRSTFPKSATASAVSRLTSRTPFACTLRPNLTGGALPRTAGGYSMGGGRTGGARYFSHTPTAPAQVVHNVSAAVRAFWLSGQKAQYDGINSAGEKRYRSVTDLQEKTFSNLRSVSRNTPGSFIDFHVNPTVTALSPLAVTYPVGFMEQSVPNLNTEGFLDVLSVDFSRALKDLAATINDLKRLASLGDLPITLEQKSILRVRFPGCDAETVERLCDEVGVQRGIIHQDLDFDSSCGGQSALLFPFASTSEHTLSSPSGSLRSVTGHDYERLDETIDEIVDNSWLDSPEGYESMEELSEGESVYLTKTSEPQNSSGFEGLEGIYRFLEQCDNARRMPD
ncbi:hypothetical protein B7494_g8200 [Chlorociboria aeruginascens]|nr:hypothetical protein B7494_g8200 [Chlorociboria aeruginascens]